MNNRSGAGGERAAAAGTVASASAKMALLAPMPSASVRAGDDGETGCRPHLPEGVGHVVSELLEPLGQSHLSISLSAEVFARPFELSEVAYARQHDLARGLRVHPALHQFTRPHFDVERELLINFLSDADTP
jgi:hypothetical protein